MILCSEEHCIKLMYTELDRWKECKTNDNPTAMTRHSDVWIVINCCMCQLLVLELG